MNAIFIIQPSELNPHLGLVRFPYHFDTFHGLEAAILEFHCAWEQILGALAPHPHDVSWTGGDTPAHRVMSRGSSNLVHGVVAIYGQELQDEVFLEVGCQRKQCHIGYISKYEVWCIADCAARDAAIIPWGQVQAVFFVYAARNFSTQA
jgi:hypothetical protein